MGYNCEYCIAKEHMGVKKGRLCLLYGIDFDEDILEYDCQTPEGKVSGKVQSIEEFHSVCEVLLELYKTDKIEKALKQFKLSGTRITGICPKSFPRTPTTIELLSLINICTGGQSGTELIHLPYSGTILDQPNKFIEAYHVFTNEYSRYLKENTKKNEPTERQR